MAYPYRLADAILAKWKPESDKAYHIKHYPNSLVAQYFTKTPNFKQLDVLAKVLKENKHRVQHKDEKVVIHIRVGDVFNPPYMTKTVQHYLDKAIMFYDNPHPPVLYIQPSSYFLKELAKFPCKQVEFVFGSHKQVNMKNSMEYLDKLTHILEKEGYTCTRRHTKDADLDFLYLCFAPYLIPSGGGFSQLAKTMNTMLKQ